MQVLQWPCKETCICKTQAGTKVKGQVQGRTIEGTVECSVFTFFCLVLAALNSSSVSVQTQCSFSSQSIKNC